MSVEIDALYKNATAVLWVEDPDTRAWLDALWLGLAPTIRVMVAGGESNVKAVCKQAEDANYRPVFGLIDQDFGTTNRPRWASLSPTERVYRLDVHEFENLLFDPPALAGCSLNTGKRTAADIEKRLKDAATSRAWWVACIRFLATTNCAATAGFPENPGSVGSLAEAEKHVRDSPWFLTTAQGCPTLADPATIPVRLMAEHATATTALVDGSWQKSFPGKEIFRDVSGYVYQNAKGVSARIDLIKAVCAWQVANSSIPTQVTDLRTAILARR